MKKIFLDNNSTTYLAKEVKDAMDLVDFPANPSSNHFYGKKAKSLLQKAKEDIAAYLKVDPDTLYFTSGGTESVNMGIKSIIEHHPNSHIIASSIDHAASISTLKYLRSKGFDVTLLPSSKKGDITLEQIKGSLKENTKLIVLSAVNTETGVKIDLEEIASFANEKGIMFFVDGIGLLGKESFSIYPGISSMAFSSHKIHGPLGVGLCYIKKDIKANPILHGGPQENNLRAGSYNLAGILGFAKAIELIDQNLIESEKSMRTLRDYFEKELIKSLKDISINGSGSRACNISSVCFKGIDAEDLLIMLDQKGVLASAGSACSSGSFEMSKVLLNMGLDPRDVRSSVRFSLSRYTTKEEIDLSIGIIKDSVESLRAF